MTGESTPQESGQATVEVVALFPLLLLIALAAAALLAGHGAREQAGHAAQAGAMAMLQGGDPRDVGPPRAARRRCAAAPRSRSTGGASRSASGRACRSSRATMTAEVTADAGPEASP